MIFSYNLVMDVDFKDKRLRLIETEKAAETGLPIAVINSCRDKLVFLRSAPNEMTLRNWRSLRYEKLKGDREGQRSIRINKQWRLVFELNNDCVPPKITILSIEDYH